MAENKPWFEIQRCMSSSKTCAETAQTLCWHCKSDLKHNDDFVVCKKCNSLRSVPEKLNYFDLFGCSEVSFKVDLKALKKKHKKLQMVLHPDRFTLSTDEEKASTFNLLVTNLKGLFVRKSSILPRNNIFFREKASEFK